MGLSLLTDATTKLSVILVVAVVVVVATPPGQLSLPGCPSKCGNIVIPYPFGIGEECAYNHYQITCNDTYNPSRPMLGDFEVLNIALLEGKLRSSGFASVACYSKNGTQIRHNSASHTLITFTFSTSDNVFAAIGCDTYAWFSGTQNGKPFNTGCMTTCNTTDEVVNGTCSGTGCCQTVIPDDVSYISKVDAKSFNNHTYVNSFNPCSSAFVVAKDALDTFSLSSLTKVPPEHYKVPVVFDWMIGTENCSTAQANGNCLCTGNSTCHNSATLDGGYHCKCLKGYSGNPYLDDGCQDVNECANQQDNDCEKPEYCVNTIGNYTCHCPKGFHGLGLKSDRCLPDEISLSTANKIVICWSYKAVILFTIIMSFCLLHLPGKVF